MTGLDIFTTVCGGSLMSARWVYRFVEKAMKLKKLRRSLAE
jgi:hypothetical protein